MRQALHPDLADVTLAQALTALGDPIRLSIVRVLSDGREHLGGDFPTSVAKSTLSHHMKTLRQAGVIHSRPDGTRCWNSLRPDFEARFPGLLGTILKIPG
ncbi:ArsR/SmtB family transcription factor [Catenuloplanes sp. NPDC051500]|uniref:ArsR/SmtB family transcription factor n=1 Tax=Catenuloplanes sp. NPDC051500 TaxID=3363959 RepID=UPI00378F2B14